MLNKRSSPTNSNPAEGLVQGLSGSKAGFYLASGAHGGGVMIIRLHDEIL